MKKLIIIIFIIFAGLTSVAQSGYDTILQQIETNNTTLSALRQQAEAQKINNRTGLLPQNPEVEFNHLWGSPAAIGNRTDFRVTQTIDFPTAYAHRNRIAGLQNENAELVYKAERLNILLSAKQICVQLSYYNALAREYNTRLQNANRIAEAYKRRLEQGDANILEHNRAQLNLNTLQAETAQIETERTALLADLRRLNGGKEILNFELGIMNFNEKNTVQNSKFEIQNSELPNNFDEWYAMAESKNPILHYVRTQIEISQQEVKLSRAMSLPKLMAGYMSERVVGERFQGVTLGISIPLWENKNRVKAAQAQTQAAEIILADNKTQFYNHLQMIYNKAVTLQENARRLRQSLGENNNEPLLKKALDAGEISLLNYLLEMEYYYDAVNKVLEMERDLEMVAAELWSVFDI
jgi:outer membrane protein TolC